MIEGRPIVIETENGFIEGAGAVIEGFNGYTKGKWWPAPPMGIKGS